MPDDTETPSPRSLQEANRLSWNAATRAHNRRKKDQAGFFRRGGSTLFQEEIDLLGELEGRTLVHLQCNAGQDSLSLASRGATVTGVDLSDEAIAFARGLAEESGFETRFEQGDVYAWLSAAASQGRSFDIAFCSYGALPWLPDLEAWARGVAGVLEPGGRLVMVEFHPAAMVYDEEGRPAFPYSSGGERITVDEGVGDYVGETGESLAPSGLVDQEEIFENPHPSHEFAWGLGEIVGAVLGAGLTLERLEEYPFSNGWKPFKNMRELPGRGFANPEGFPDLPLMFALVARKAD